MPLKSSLLQSSLALLLLTVAARADLAFVLTPSVQSGVGSAEVSFTGTLTNTSLTGNLSLNNVQFAFTDAATNYLSATPMFSLGMFPASCCPLKLTRTSCLASGSPRALLPASILGASPSWAARMFSGPQTWPARLFKSPSRRRHWHSRFPAPTSPFPGHRLREILRCR
jgi:hypothetical protein